VRYDEDDEPPIRHAPPYPGTVRTAGIVWIVFGSLILLNLLGVLLITFVFVAGGGPGREGAVGGALCVGGVIGLFGGAFLFVGVQSVRGTAADTLGNGIGSIVIGLLVLAAGAFTAAAADGAGNAIGGGVNGLAGLALVLAGILALVGRGAYRDWRRANLPERRRRRYDDDDRYDDRPRRPRYRDEDDYPPRRPPRRDDDDRYSE